jgi:hypothetical protein
MSTPNWLRRYPLPDLTRRDGMPGEAAREFAQAVADALDQLDDRVTALETAAGAAAAPAASTAPAAKAG